MFKSMIADFQSRHDISQIAVAELRGLLQQVSLSHYSILPTVNHAPALVMLDRQEINPVVEPPGDCSKDRRRRVGWRKVVADAGQWRGWRLPGQSRRILELRIRRHSCGESEYGSCGLPPREPGSSSREDDPLIRPQHSALTLLFTPQVLGAQSAGLRR
jgi:hypothetical protein